jgi:hypothetical protein
VLSPAAPFQLLARDGVVFYNDTNSERAGIVQFNGTVVKAAKYDPANPTRGLTEQHQNASQTRQPQQGGRSNQPTRPATTATRSPGRADPDVPRPPQPNQPNRTDQSNQPGQPGDRSPRGTDQPDQPDQPDSSVPTSPERALPQLEISMSNAAPTENQPVTLQVKNTNGDAPRSAQWTFGDGGEGEGTTTTHKWTTARPNPYLVTVTATMPDDQVATTSVNVTVSQTPRARLTVNASAGGRVSGGGIDCPATCSVDLELDTQVTLSAVPDATHQLGHWGNACGGTANTCDVTVDAGKTVTYTFDLKPTPKFVLTIAPPSGGTITAAGSSCPGTCQISLDPGTVVQLGATPSQGFSFDSWGGDCPQRFTCTLTMDRNHAVSARFVPPAFINSLNCRVNPNNKKRFLCEADAGPPESQDGAKWNYGGLGVLNHSFSVADECPGETFEVSLTLGALSKSQVVANCG